MTDREALGRLVRQVWMDWAREQPDPKPSWLAGWDELDAHPELERRHGEYAESLAEAVLAIRDWWLPLRKEKSTLRREDPKTGRNDLCPCGSGRKYKKCCGINE